METRNILSLLSGEYLVVPEIQREYVWGDKVNQDKLKIFIDNINDSAKDDSMNIGFLYTYHAKPKECYIIDGQQRFTSIILLLYVLAKKENTWYQFNDLLNIDSPKLKFSYNVRPLTEEFMSNLFKEHDFINTKSVRDKIWYIGAYDKDMTIQSMLNAVEVMLSWNISIKFEQVLKNIEFWYFGVEETSQGEELYITMNSRGQKLTNTEQIKPHFFAQLANKDIEKYGKLWDECEEYFYKNRPKESNKNVMVLVDSAMNNFIRMVVELETCKQENDIVKCSNQITLPIIETWYNALKNIPSTDGCEEEINRLYKTDEDSRFYVLKALLCAAYNHIEDAREFERIRQTMRNRTIRKKLENHQKLLCLLKKFRDSQLTSFYDFVLSGVDITDVFDKNDMIKLEICNRLNDNQLEDLFWREEHHCIWNGDISTFINWAIDEDKNFDISIYKVYVELFKQLFKNKDNELMADSNLDEVRCALLTRHINDYPRYFKGLTNQCFCYLPQHWKNVFDNNSSEMKDFFDDLLKTESPYIGMEQMIKDYDLGENYSEFVKDKKLLEFTELKNIRWIDDTLYLFKSQKGAHANIHAYKYYLMLKRTGKEFGSGWKLDFWPQGQSCAYYNQVTDKSRLISIDMIWNTEKDRSKMEIDCFMKKNDKNNISEDELAQYTCEYLRSLGESLDYVWIDNRYRITVDQPDDEQQSFSIMDKHRTKLLSKIEELDL